MTIFTIAKDNNGFPSYGITFTGDNTQVNLSVGVAQSFTLPTTYPFYMVIFNYTPGTDVWVSPTTVATVAPGTFTSTTSQLSPMERVVPGGTTLSFITSSANSEVGVSWYAQPNVP
jgi:hypothetical protein